MRELVFLKLRAHIDPNFSPEFSSLDGEQPIGLDEFLQEVGRGGSIGGDELPEVFLIVEILIFAE
jgi:hypothetical protein